MSRKPKYLPTEILENVLARLPVHVLCRFRLVCKAWNHLIIQPSFAFLRAQLPRQASYVLITPRLVDFLVQRRWDWEILDMAEKRIYTLNDSYIRQTYYLRGNNNNKWDFGKRHILAADRGLIYAKYDAFGIGIWEHIVRNPMSQSFHHITKPDFLISHDRSIVVMSVDSPTQSYRIIILEPCDREAVYLYDSTTTQWRKLCKVPDNYRAYSSIFLKGVFYALFVDISVVPWCSKLYSCDLETGAWRYIDAELPKPCHPQEKSLLVVCLGRLFLIDYTGFQLFPFNYRTSWEILFANYQRIDPLWTFQYVIKVSIWEILLAEKEVVKVVEMPKYSVYPRELVERSHGMGDALVAVGCGDSIIISSKLGPCMAFDLLKNCWHELPGNSKHSCGTDGSRNGIYAGILDLDFEGNGGAKSQNN